MSNDAPTKPPATFPVYQPPRRPLEGLRKSVMGVQLPSVAPAAPVVQSGQLDRSGQLGPKKQAPRKSAVELRSAPEHENTRMGSPAPPYNPPRVGPPPLPKTVQTTGQPPISTLKGIGGPEPEPPRSHTPAPWERESMVDKVEAELGRRGERLERAPVSLPPPSAGEKVVRHEYGVDKGTRVWLVALATMVFGTGGVAVYGAVREPPVAVQEAPKKAEENARELTRMREDVGECRVDLREAERNLDRLERRTDSLERKFYDLDKRTPKLNP